MIETIYEHTDINPLEFSYLAEKDRILEIQNALLKLNSSNDFAFYNMKLTEQDQNFLSEIEIKQFNNFIINSTETTINQVLISKILKSFSGLSLKENILNWLGEIITKFTSNILSATQSNDCELMIRTLADYKNNCPSWHIDKSYQEILEENKSQNFIPQKLFIFPLIGSPTIFQNGNITIKNDFLKSADENKYFYGYTENKYCSSEDNINKLFSQGNIEKPTIGYGSVHITGRMGTIHSEPIESQSRLLLLIRPL